MAAETTSTIGERDLMKWVKRGLWLAAWSFWIWLGFGLYRELPKELGPVVCKLPIAKSTKLLGFVDGSGDVVVFESENDGRRAAFRVFDAETGTLIRQFPSPGAGHVLWQAAAAVRTHGVVITNESAQNPNGIFTALLALDVKSGEQRRLSERAAHAARAHHSRPWVAAIVGDEASRTGRRVVVFDFRSGNELFSRANFPSGTSSFVPFFLKDSDRLVVPLQSGLLAGPAAAQFEVWDLGPPSKLVHVGPGTGLGAEPAVALGGRVAFAEQDEPWSVDVFGISEGKFLFSLPPRDQRDRLFPARFQPPIAESGRTVLAGKPVALYEVDTGARVWEGSHFEFAIPAGGGEGRFRVYEIWSRLWERWNKSLNLTTVAVRRLEDGSLVYRTTNVDALVLPSNCNKASTIGVANDGRVYRLPPRPNYPLLALCQAILALPLVLLWAVLQWRRRRRIRMASVAP